MMQTINKKKDINDYLNEVDYRYLNSSEYVPSEFSLIFMNFIKLVNGEQGESHKTPPVHLKMLDGLTTKDQYLVNLCFRGSGKTSVFAEYLILYLATFGQIPGFGTVSGMIYISDTMENGVKSLRKNIEFRYNNSEFLQNWVPNCHFTDPYLEFQNKEGHMLGVKMFGALSGLRGTKIFGKRPVLAVGDDLISDETGKSPTSMLAIKDTIYKGLNHALDPTRRKVVLNGTPFNKEDLLIEAVESGAWKTNVYPVCEKFPCTEEEFQSAWEDRFTYEFVKAQYDMAVDTGKLSSFYQELMLRISTEEERLVQDAEIRWYSRAYLINNKGNYNFYITTDFATSSKQYADNSVISVWAYNANGDWFFVDGIVEKQTMDKTIDDLFRLVSEYHPQEVGIEINGQQGAFIKWLQQEMHTRNIWFNFAKDKASSDPGIRTVTDKLKKFNVVVPWFKAGKIYYPEEWKKTKVVGQHLSEISLVTDSGIKGKDDCIDTISMLPYLRAWKPSEGQMPSSEDSSGFWEESKNEEQLTISSYIV